ncbi:MAG: hypothetical protein QXL46_03280 [Nitrososphaerales archaeon]
MSKKKSDSIKEMAEELDVFDEMISALVELLEEKGLIKYEEWEERIRKRVEGRKGLKSYKEVK